MALDESVVSEDPLEGLVEFVRSIGEEELPVVLGVEWDPVPAQQHLNILGVPIGSVRQGLPEDMQFEAEQVVESDHPSLGAVEVGGDCTCLHQVECPVVDEHQVEPFLRIGEAELGKGGSFRNQNKAGSRQSGSPQFELVAPNEEVYVESRAGEPMGGNRESSNDQIPQWGGGSEKAG